MRAADKGRSALVLQALYTIPELARAAGISRFLMGRILLAQGVTLVRSGRLRLVPVVEIEERLPLLWHSIELAEVARQKAKLAALRASSPAEGR